MDNDEFFFFFQAEDGIRDFHVTGVQTCDLPILVGAPPNVEPSPPPCTLSIRSARPVTAAIGKPPPSALAMVTISGAIPLRSEERRVGKDGRSRWWPKA